MVTGGSDYPNPPLATVQEYTLSGPQYPQPPLPDLLTGRLGHACAHYMDNEDRVVSIACNITAHLTIVAMHCFIIITMCMQVLFLDPIGFLVST